MQKREVKIGLEQNEKATVNKIIQERGLVIRSKREIESMLADARTEVNLLEEQQKTAAKGFTNILNDYEERLRQRDSAVTASEQDPDQPGMVLTGGDRILPLECVVHHETCHPRHLSDTIL